MDTAFVLLLGVASDGAGMLPVLDDAISLELEAAREEIDMVAAARAKRS